MESFSSIISKVPLFKGLSPEETEKIQRICVDKMYNKGELIFSEGDLADGFYIVADGTVKIFKNSLEGKEQILHMFGAGEPFGEVPVFSGSAFPANALATEKSRLFFFPRDAFIRFISENTGVVLNMLGVLSMRLRQFTVQVENLSLKEVPGRLASHLIFLAEEQDNQEQVTLPVSKGQLASLLGTIPETLSRILKKMSNEAIIEVDGKTIHLIDMPALHDLAEHGRI